MQAVTDSRFWGNMVAVLHCRCHEFWLCKQSIAAIASAHAPWSKKEALLKANFNVTYERSWACLGELNFIAPWHSYQEAFASDLSCISLPGIHRDWSLHCTDCLQGSWLWNSLGGLVTFFDLSGTRHLEPVCCAGIHSICICLRKLNLFLSYVKPEWEGTDTCHYFAACLCKVCRGNTVF